MPGIWSLRGNSRHTISTAPPDMLSFIIHTLYDLIFINGVIKEKCEPPVWKLIPKLLFTKCVFIIRL